MISHRVLGSRGEGKHFVTSPSPLAVIIRYPDGPSRGEPSGASARPMRVQLS